MATVLLYNVQPAKAAKLKMLCRNFFIETVTVVPEDYGKKIAFLLGESADSTEKNAEMFEEEMLFFSDVDNRFLGILLNQIRRKKLGVSLKAVKTAANVQFTSYELYRELCAERAALSGN